MKIDKSTKRNITLLSHARDDHLARVPVKLLMRETPAAFAPTSEIIRVSTGGTRQAVCPTLFIVYMVHLSSAWEMVTPSHTRALSSGRPSLSS